MGMKKIYGKLQRKDAFNKDILRGLSSSISSQVPLFIDDTCKNGVKMCHEFGLEYKGYRLLTPEEEIGFIAGSSKKVLDCNKNTLRLIELHHTLHGEELPPRRLYIPYIEDKGRLVLDNTELYVCPVLTDSVISPSTNSVFVKLNADKLNFNKQLFPILQNNNMIPTSVVYSSDLIRNNAKKTIGKTVSPIAMYVFLKYGILNTLKRYSNKADIRFYKDGRVPAEVLKTHDIFNNAPVKPKWLKRPEWKPDTLKIAIEKGKYDELTIKYITALLYITGTKPEIVEEGFIDFVTSGDIQNENLALRLLIGWLTFYGNYTPEHSITVTDQHLSTIATYIDNKARGELAEIGHKVDDFYDLAEVLIQNYDAMITRGKTYINSLETRYIEVLYYLLYDIMVGINRSYREITRNARKEMQSTGNRVKIGAKTVNDVFKRNLRANTIKFIKGSQPGLQIYQMESSNDNIFFKTNSILELQERGNGTKRGNSRSAFPVNIRQLYASQIFQGNVLNLKKGSPTPLRSLNPFARLTPNGKFIANEEILKTISLIDEYLNHKISEDKSHTLDDIIFIDDNEIEAGR
jgi:hypothetical protein